MSELFANFTRNTLTPWQWAMLALIPPAIVAVCFLKLKRTPLEVPSTYLSRKSIEDLHVNSIWQRLRQSLLLLLQLLVVLLAMLALLRPGWSGSTIVASRSVFLVDNSASMSATDIDPSRLVEAKKRVLELIDQMPSGGQAMIVSFSDTAEVVQEFTDNRRLLRRRLSTIQPTARGTSLAGALELAAGLANPGSIAVDETDVAVADALPAVLFIFSDGRFEDVEGFSLGNLQPMFIPLGKDDTHNVAVAAFSTRADPSGADRRQAFARLINHGPKEARVGVQLELDGQLIDADEVSIDAGESRSIVFELGQVKEGELTLSIDTGDALALDDVAYAAVNPPRRARVLLATPGNEALELALATEHTAEIAAIEMAEPAILSTAPYRKRAESGYYDLVIYDQCVPEQMPQCNTLFIGRIPPGEGWKGAKQTNTVRLPQILDSDRAHPLMQLVEVSNIDIDTSRILSPPSGGSVLVESDQGPILAIGPRGGFEDAVLGFEIYGFDSQGRRYVNTNWPIRLSFPTFLLNALEYLGGHGQVTAVDSVRCGSPVELASRSGKERLVVETPGGRRQPIQRKGDRLFQYHGTEELGIYKVHEGEKVTGRFAVNLNNSQESDIARTPEKTIQIGYVDVKGRAGWERARRDLWKFLLLAVLAILLFEWYIYNRRVYI